MRNGVHLGHRPAVHIPQVEPCARAGHDVAGHLIDGHGRDWADVARHVLDVNVAGEVPDDGGAVTRARYRDAPT